MKKKKALCLQFCSLRKKVFTKDDFYSLNTKLPPDKAKKKTLLNSTKFDVKHLIDNPCK